MKSSKNIKWQDLNNFENVKEERIPTLDEIVKMKKGQRENLLVQHYGKLLNFDRIENPTAKQIYNSLLNERKNAALFRYFDYDIVLKCVDFFVEMEESCNMNCGHLFVWD